MCVRESRSLPRRAPLQPGSDLRPVLHERFSSLFSCRQEFEAQRPGRFARRTHRDYLALDDCQLAGFPRDRRLQGHAEGTAVGRDEQRTAPAELLDRRVAGEDGQPHLVAVYHDVASRERGDSRWRTRGCEHDRCSASDRGQRAEGSQEGIPKFDRRVHRATPSRARSDGSSMLLTAASLVVIGGDLTDFVASAQVRDPLATIASIGRRTPGSRMEEASNPDQKRHRHDSDCVRRTSPESAHRLALHVRDDVDVGVECDGDPGVAEDLLENLRVLAGLQPEPKVVEAGRLWQAGLHAQRLVAARPYQGSLLRPTSPVRAA